MRSHLKTKLWTKIVNDLDAFDNLWSREIEV